jgi:negative regulator of sigma E activity
MQLSAFADGELPDNEKELLLRRLSQDPELRCQVAEYLAIGRVIRGEPPVHGIETLRDRVAAAIGALDVDGAETAPPSAAPSVPMGSRLLKPLAGVATAAAVALLAIFGLQQLGDTPVAPVAGPTVAGETSFSTQPAPENLLDSYRLMHEAEAADNSMRARFTSIELRQGLAEEADRDALPEADVVPDDDGETGAESAPVTE